MRTFNCPNCNYENVIYDEHCYRCAQYLGTVGEKDKRVPVKRDSWDVYFLKIAHQIATRATCDRKHVGCVIVRNRAILTTGYNGSIRGMAHCDDVGHMMVEGHCVRTIHAEANAFVQAARNGVSVQGAAVYCTAFPCWECFKLVTNAGIIEIVYDEPYRVGDSYTRTSQICYDLGIKFRQVELTSQEK